MIRRFVYFIVGFLLSANVVLAFAGTYSPSVVGWSSGNISGKSSAVEACQAYASANPPPSGYQWEGLKNPYTNPAFNIVTAYTCGYQICSGGSCSSGANWSSASGAIGCANGGTYNSSTKLCEKTCPAGQTLSSNGSCGCPAGQSLVNGTCVPDKQCEPSQILRDGQCVCDPAHLAAFPTAYGGAMEGAGSAPDQACVGGCMRKSGDFCLGGGNKWWCSGGAWTTQTCSGGPTDTKMPDNKKPPCAASEGVLTSSKGTVACVPEGTPDARKPGITEKKKTETFPDGSKKETKETTTRDPATNATETTTTTTTTAGPTGGTSAGTTGTTTTDSSQSSSKGSNGAGGDGDGGDGDCDPTLNFCGGPKTDDLYTKKEKTVSSVLNTFTSGIKNSQLGSAMNGFFTITTPSGGCPNWVINVSYLNTIVDLSQYFCTGTAINMMDLVGSVLLALASFVAFRWAIL